MSNTLGNLFKLTSFGESHGKAIGCIIDGIPSGISINKYKFQIALNNRKPGTNKFITNRNEPDQINFLSGLYRGITIGTPLSFLINNINHHSQDYSSIKEIFRPGHADLTYFLKYEITNPNGGGRSSARTTIALVIAGTLTKLILSDFFNLNLFAYLSSIELNYFPISSISNISSNNLFIPNIKTSLIIKTHLSNIRRKGNSLGSIITLLIHNPLIGIGEPLYHKISSELTKELMNLNATKAISIGLGKKSTLIYGSLNNDQIYEEGFISNNSGGILGGITSGQDIKIKIFIKPTSSISISQSSIGINGENRNIKVFGRHDPCVGIRSIPIIESISSIILFDNLLKCLVTKFL